jgi:hypothetical protein
MRIKLLVTHLALSAGAGAARADGLLYVGAGISDNKLEDIGDSLSHIHDASWKLLGGTRPRRWLAVEGDYLDLGSHTDQYFGGTGSVHSDAQAFAAYAVGFLPLPIPFLDIYGKAGLANWRLHQDTNLAPGDFFHYSDNGTDFAWGVGGQVHFGNVGARLEHESFSVANTSGAKVISLDAVVSLF